MGGLYCLGSDKGCRIQGLYCLAVNQAAGFEKKMQDKDMAARLARIREKRGYLLPHHGLMAVSLPGMLDAYDELYSAIAFEPHTLSRREHEFVWLAVLITRHEVLGTHHIARFHEAGGTDAELADVLSLAAVAGGGHLYRFVDRKGMPHVAGLDRGGA